MTSIPIKDLQAQLAELTKQCEMVERRRDALSNRLLGLRKAIDGIQALIDLGANPDLFGDGMEGKVTAHTNGAASTPTDVGPVLLELLEDRPKTITQLVHDLKRIGWKYPEEIKSPGRSIHAILMNYRRLNQVERLDDGHWRRLN